MLQCNLFLLIFNIFPFSDIPSTACCSSRTRISLLSPADHRLENQLQWSLVKYIFLRDKQLALSFHTTGLSFFRKEEDTNVTRLLISRHQNINNVQDITRKELFEKESVIKFFHPTTDDEMFEDIANNKPDGGEMMICIDNFPSKCDTVTL